MMLRSPSVRAAASCTLAGENSACAQPLLIPVRLKISAEETRVLQRAEAQLAQMGLRGARFYAGYGDTEADLLGSQKYALIYTVR